MKIKSHDWRQYGILWYETKYQSMVEYNRAQYSIIQYGIIQYGIIHIDLINNMT